MKNLMPKLLSLQTFELSLQPRSAQEEETVLKLRAEIPKPILDHLDRFLARGKKGLALVRGTSCGECHLVIPIGTLHQLKHQAGVDIHICDNCGRYLYLPNAASEPKAMEVAGRSRAERVPTPSPQDAARVEPLARTTARRKWGSLTGAL